LIEEGLEEMKVATIDESDLRIGAFQGLRGDKAGEASADDDDTVRAGVHDRCVSR
jgi:hypothetical protein